MSWRASTTPTSWAHVSRADSILLRWSRDSAEGADNRFDALSRLRHHVKLRHGIAILGRQSDRAHRPLSVPRVALVRTGRLGCRGVGLAGTCLRVVWLARAKVEPCALCQVPTRAVPRLARSEFPWVGVPGVWVHRDGKARQPTNDSKHAKEVHWTHTGGARIRFLALEWRCNRSGKGCATPI